MKKIYDFLGGRKQTNAYLYIVVLFGAARYLDADFGQFALWSSVGLLGTSVAHAVEDGAKHLAGSRPTPDASGERDARASSVARDTGLL